MSFAIIYKPIPSRPFRPRTKKRRICTAKLQLEVCISLLPTASSRRGLHIRDAFRETHLEALRPVAAEFVHGREIEQQRVRSLPGVDELL